MKLSHIIQAARPKTLPAAIVPVCLGCVLAWKFYGIFYLGLALSTLLGAICIQIATNFFNDAIDADKGADTAQRIGPQRVTASGKMSRKLVYGWAVIFLIAASFFGLHLMLARGWVILAIGIPSLYLSYGYTGGPLPLAYRGLGELFVIVFFGWIAVMGSVFVQVGEWTVDAFVLGTQVGLLSAVLILVNNIRDKSEDEQTGKHTLAVMWGQKRALNLLYSFFFVCFGMVFYWYWREPSALYLLPYLSLPLGVWICAGVKKQVATEGTGYNRYLAIAALQLLVFAALWSVAAVFTDYV